MNHLFQRFLKSWVFNPFVQALVVTILVFIFTMQGVHKYKIELTEYRKTDITSENYFIDLDHDLCSELILTGRNIAGNSFLTLFDDDKTRGQWNFMGIFGTHSARLMLGDYNKNNDFEIYLFTLSGDSILLHCIEYQQVPKLLFNDKFIARIGKNENTPDYRIVPGKVSDLDGDGYGELIFALSAGFSKQPRNVFAYDINHDSLLKSPQSGSFIAKLKILDLDEDGKEEIILGTTASGNISDTLVPYSDYSCWLMVLDDNLKFLFPPIEFAGEYADLVTEVIYKKSGDCLLLSSYTYFGSLDIKDRLFITDISGRILKEKIVESTDTPGPTVLFSTNEYKNSTVQAVIRKLGIFTIDTALRLKCLLKYDIYDKKYSIIDIDNNGTNEYLFSKFNSNEHIILEQNLKNPIYFDANIQSIDPVITASLKNAELPRLSVQSDDEYYLFTYGINPMYRWKWIIFMGIYIAFLVFILLIRLLQHIQLKRRYETEKKLTAFQLSSIKSQMDPHFIYNVINTIGSSIYKENRDEAYKSVVNFSTMVRTLLASSDQLSRPLSEELEFTRSFLELQKARFRDKFDYLIELSSDCDEDIEIPKMIIQTHAENAIKHGLAPKESPGRLHIKIFPEKNYLMIEIEDNGVGRGYASQHGTASTGKGLRIIEQFFKMYNRYNKPPIHQEIIDLYDAQENPAGTKVVISVPLNYNRNVTTG
ncbi:MAG TPA: histidine kinase [Bacteroidales bacterium]|nr:histidine kinase [Bacteroidales bacterium]HRZ20698.1 histidine kinase [Bacteroidales bacterium]